MDRIPNSKSSENQDDANSAKRPSVYNSPSNSASGSGSTTVTSPMSLGVLLNDTAKEEKEQDNRIVKMLSLNTQASHANLRPVPLISNYRSPSTEGSSGSTPSHFRAQADAPRYGLSDTRKRAREEDEEEIQYLGRTPSTWKKWEASGGVRSENGSPYCYAYDDAGQRYKPELSFVFMIRLVIAASPRKRLSLASIYQAIEERWPYFKDHDITTWKNSVRHCLSFNSGFISIDRSTASSDQRAEGGGGGGRGGYWTLAEAIQTSIPIPLASPSGPYWRSNPVSPSTDEPYKSKSRPTRYHDFANTKSRHVIHSKPYPDAEVSPTIIQDQSLHSSPQNEYSPYQQHPAQNYYPHLGSRSSATPSSSNRSSLTQASDLGIEMSRAFLAEKPDLDHILDVDMVAPGQ